MERLRTTLAEGVARQIFTQEQADEILGRITADTSDSPRPAMRTW